MLLLLSNHTNTGNITDYLQAQRRCTLTDTSALLIKPAKHRGSHLLRVNLAPTEPFCSERSRAAQILKKGSSARAAGKDE